MTQQCVLILLYTCVLQVSGGHTLFTVDRWKRTGPDKLLQQAVCRGTVMVGAICWCVPTYVSSHHYMCLDAARVCVSECSCMYVYVEIFLEKR